MARIFQPLLFMLAKCTRNELIRQIQFLKAENEMLRKRIPARCIYLKDEERSRLIELGQAIGPPIQHLITIVGYWTYRSWIRKLNNKVPKKRTGRPRTPEAIRELILRIARENSTWGYTRVLGELKKLGYSAVSRQTVVNIMKEAGFDPNSRRGPGSWDELLKMQAQTLWQCDFFSKRILTRLGVPQVCALVFLNVATRKVWVSPCTKKPTGAWVKTQLDAFVAHTKQKGLPVKLVSRDRDKKYRNNFDLVMNANGIDVNVLAYRSPNTNAFVERFIQFIQDECIDRFVICGEKHLDYLVREYVDHYHEERPHQGLGNKLLTGQPPPEVGQGEVRCRTRLGGRLKHYYRAVA